MLFLNGLSLIASICFVFSWCKVQIFNLFILTHYSPVGNSSLILGFDCVPSQKDDDHSRAPANPLNKRKKIKWVLLSRGAAIYHVHVYTWPFPSAHMCYCGIRVCI